MLDYKNPRIAEINKILDEHFDTMVSQEIADLLVERTDLQEQEERERQIDITNGILAHNKMLRYKQNK